MTPSDGAPIKRVDVVRLVYRLHGMSLVQSVRPGMSDSQVCRLIGPPSAGFSGVSPDFPAPASAAYVFTPVRIFPQIIRYALVLPDPETVTDLGTLFAYCYRFTFSGEGARQAAHTNWEVRQPLSGRLYTAAGERHS